MYKTILVPVDLSELPTSQPAIDRAVALASASGGTIRLINVRSIVPMTYMEFVPPSFDQEQQEEAETKLAEVAAGPATGGSRIGGGPARVGLQRGARGGGQDRHGPYRDRLAPAHDGDLSPRLQCLHDRPPRALLGPGGAGLGPSPSRPERAGCGGGEPAVHRVFASTASHHMDRRAGPGPRGDPGGRS